MIAAFGAWGGMGDLYDPAIYDGAAPAATWWAESAGAPIAGCGPLEGEAACEVAVIGGGYTGLSAAFHLARYKGVDVRVVEAGSPGWGASGRNGGFCDLGGTKLSAAGMAKRWGIDEARRYFAAAAEAIALVADLAVVEGIDIEAAGRGEICVAHRPSAMAELVAEAEALERVAGIGCELWSRESLAARAFHGPEAYGALYSPLGFGLHPLKYARGLARAAIRHGARVYGQSPVIAWRREAGSHRLITPTGSLTARRVLVATNGFTRETLHRGVAGRLLPVLSNIVVTRPLDDAERAAQGWRAQTPIYDSRRLLFYFRLLPDGRFLFGARGGTDAGASGAVRARAWMVRRLGRSFPAWAGVEVTHFWRCLACLSRRLTPFVGRLDDESEVYASLAYHGSGVAMGTWCGRAAARMIAGRHERLPAPIAAPLARFPVPGLRLWYLRLAYAVAGVRDAWL